MRAAALFSLLIVGAFCQSSFELYNIPAQLLSTGNNAQQLCVHQNLMHCQASFNKALNLTSDLDWTDVGTMANQTSLYYLQGISGFLQVCSARQQFQACLGDMYPACMSVTRFVADGEDAISASQYIQLFNEIEFDCNGGFVQLTSNYACVLGIWMNNYQDLLNCVNQFNLTMNTVILSTKLNLLRTPANTARLLMLLRSAPELLSKLSASWWQCERTRVGAGLDQLCPTNFCTVQQTAKAAMMAETSRREGLAKMMQGSEERNRVMQKLAEKARLRGKEQ